MPTPKALHSKATPKWGTPPHIIEAARQLLQGTIHLDPASSPEFNQLVQALLIYTEHDNGLNQPWGGNVFLNPPGGLVTDFWEKLSHLVATGEVERAFWVGFSVEQLCTLASSEFHPLDFSTCILRKRLAFNTEALTKGGAPAHGNYVTGLNVDRDLFDRLFRSQGRVVHGVLA
jgi:hypothetical protein